MEDDEVGYYELHEIVTQKLGHLPIAKGDFSRLPKKVKDFVVKWVTVCQPRGIFICDGSNSEAEEIVHKLEERGTLHKLDKYENSYICRTDPVDVARVESKTWMCTDNKYKTVPHVMEGVKGILGQWKSEEEGKELLKAYDGCMKGRMMYIIPFSMGPIGSPLSKIGVEITDSNYVVLSMRIMTRVAPKIWDVLGDGDFVRCVHSVGLPRPVQRKMVNNWPCNPEKLFIGHFPKIREICSFGSGYGGNSLLGKKCFALRIASNIAKDEGWLAEHMLIMGITEIKTGRETFIAAAFPSACGKTNMAMLTPSIPGYEVRCVGDDIAWMRFDEKGQLRGINPEAGFFGVCPGTNMKTNPNAILSCEKNTIFTNVAETADGRYYWEGLEDTVEDETSITTWKNENVTKKSCQRNNKLTSHPNSRFCAPASQCPIIHPKWEDKEGVPISAIIFGGRRPQGVPLVFETFSWEHGVMVGACVKSETTAAAEFTGKQIMHDPMAMRPFMGYNFGNYLDHWLELDEPKHKMPKIFHVNWFRVDDKGKFLWPGFGENIRVIDWIIKRVHGDKEAENVVKSPIGLLPAEGTLNCDGLKENNWNKLFDLPKHYWEEDIIESKRFLNQQVGTDLPEKIRQQLDEQEKRINAMNDGGQKQTK